MSMDTEGDRASLRLDNERLREENDDLKFMLGLVKENLDLKSKVHSSSMAKRDAVNESTGRKTTLQWQDTLDESRFRNDLHPPPNTKAVHRTSSPIKLESCTTRCTKPRGKEELASFSQSCLSTKGKDPEKLLGEIAFQLDRRILAHVFDALPRLYGFTVPNIRDKIIQVSTDPLTGEVDERQRLQLSQRHAELMNRLNKHGYNASLHPPFTEFIINTYGILKQRLDSHGAQELGFNNPDVLQREIINAAPGRLLKDLLVLFSCLSYMARQDGQPFFLW